jgi:hypothetical protein
MAIAPLKLTRDQFATFLQNQEQIKQFENLLTAVNGAVLNVENPNLVFAGPVAGDAAQPTFRALVPADIPTLDYVESVGATAPITSTGGFNPVIGVTGSALTKTDDTNVTLTIGGSPSDALLAAVSLALGWTGTLAISRGGTGASTDSGARTNLGLGTIATQNANNVNITGGSISNITDLAVADGGTGASDAATARTNLGLGGGLSVTITTAKLTVAGANGSMTFTNGILTAQTQAT